MCTFPGNMQARCIPINFKSSPGDDGIKMRIKSLRIFYSVNISLLNAKSKHIKTFQN